MYVRSKTSRLSPRKTVQIVEAFVASDGKRRQRIVQHLGVAFDEKQLQELWALGECLIPELEARAREEKALRRGQGLLFEMEPEDFERPIPEEARISPRNLRNGEHVLEGPFEVWADVFSKLGFDGIFGTGVHDIGSTNLLKLCLTAKLSDGGSKRRSVRWINERLGLELGKDRVYRMMDRLAARIDRVKEAGFSCGRHICGDDVSLVLFDVTTLYFESFEEDVEPSAGSNDNGATDKGLRKNGYSKDNKINETQVVLALAASSEGIPLWYELFPGNMPEGKTLLSALDAVGTKLNPEELWLVADNAMLSTTNRQAMEERKYRYVLGSSVRKLTAEEKAQVLDFSGYTTMAVGARNGFGGDSEVEGRRRYRVIRRRNGNALVVTWSESKARRDAHKREKLRRRLEKKLDGNGEIAANRLIANRGTAKYVTPVEREARYRLKIEKLEEDALYDGLHGIETNSSVTTEADVERVLSAYRNLWRIEDNFRVAKSDLKIRPIFHWTEERIRAHVAMCFLALLMERYLEKQLERKRRISMSPRAIRDALAMVQSALVRDLETGILYRLPVRMSASAREIYKALGLRRSSEPTEITSLPKYRHRIPKCTQPERAEDSVAPDEEDADGEGISGETEGMCNPKRSAKKAPRKRF